MEHDYKELVRQLKSCVFTVVYPELAENAANVIQFLTERLSVYENNCIIFPQTIGDITFYSKAQLLEWIENQQKSNKRQYDDWDRPIGGFHDD